MKTITTEFLSGALSRLFKAIFMLALLPALMLMLSAQSSHAGSATWKATPATGDWSSAANWTPMTVPNGSLDTATFAATTRPDVSLSADNEVNGITFNSGASPITITIQPTDVSSSVLTISGVGIINNSGITQQFICNGATYTFGDIQFLNGSNAGDLTSFILNGGAYMSFYKTSTAANGTFTFKGDPGVGFFGTSHLVFYDSSSAANGSFILSSPASIDFHDSSIAANAVFSLTSDPGVDYGCSVYFSDASTAGTSIFTVDGGIVSGAYGGYVQLDSSAGNGSFTINGGVVSGAYGANMFISGNAEAAILIANAGSSGGEGGAIYLTDDSIGASARVEVFGNGNLDISLHTAPGVTVGSIEGNGLVFLGGNPLTVGSNNLSTAFSGKIQNGGIAGGTGGSLTKTGKGKLTLSKANTYTGGTTISKGTLLVTNKSGTGTGTGAVQVSAGTLGGTGQITGAVTVASGPKTAFLAPGSGQKPGTLTIRSALTFNSLATYREDLNSTTALSDKVVAFGVTINSGAQITLTDLGTGTLTPGTVFTVISNTAATPIAGVFTNLADNSTVTVGGNTYQVSYDGGTGNDLTLTVVL